MEFKRERLSVWSGIEDEERLNQSRRACEDQTDEEQNFLAKTKNKVLYFTDLRLAYAHKEPYTVPAQQVPA